MPRKTTPNPVPTPDAPDKDTNSTIAALLRDLAAVQRSQQSRWGYKRAARAVMQLDVPIETLRRPDGSLAKIPNVGPSSLRVIEEVLRTGSSPTVEKAIEASDQSADVVRRRDLREHFLSRAQVVAALEAPRRGAVRPADYKGDLQMHSTWSDGGQSLADIISAGKARGYLYCAVTDHSYGLPIAGGISMNKAIEQHLEIDRLNKAERGRFRLLKGIEANIRADGSVDMERHELRAFEIVVAAPHSALRSASDQTDRMVRAASAPGVHILGHPRGRMYGSRPGVSADWRAVFRAAASAGVAVEIDGDPSRQDVDHVLARDALKVGCLFALDSDAHSTGELAYAETAIGHARLAGIPPERIINCWPLDRLLEWAETRRRLL